MIKGSGKTPLGLPVLFLGLSGENVTRLAAGEPIVVRPSEMAGLDLPVMSVVIGYGRTEEDIVETLRSAGLMPEGGEGR